MRRMPVVIAIRGTVRENRLRASGVAIAICRDAPFTGFRRADHYTSRIQV